MLKLPKGLKKKKKGKKSKRKGEEELFTEEELEKYRREHQQQNTANEEGTAKENEEWSKFKDLTTGVDSVLKKTQGDLDRIKSTSFFQRIPTGTKQVESEPKEIQHRPVVEVTEADFPHLVQSAAETDNVDRSDYGLTDDESEDEDQDDIFDTSYVEAVERGEVKLAYVPDSPEQLHDDDIFDTSHVDALIKGQEAKNSKGKQTLDIGLAVGVLTGRIDNVTVTTKRSKRLIPGDLLLEYNEGKEVEKPKEVVILEPEEKSILDIDPDIPITSPIDLSISLHTPLIQQNKPNQEKKELPCTEKDSSNEEIDEFTLLAAKSLEVSSEITKLVESEINLEPVLQESWSAFEANKIDTIFAESIVEDQIDVIDPYLGQDDPFDTSFADVITQSLTQKEAIVLEDDDDDFDPRAEEVQVSLNNRRKSSVRIHLTDPSGLRESITSDDIIDKEEAPIVRDLLGGSTTDLTQLGDSPLDPVEVNNSEIDPFDTTIVDRIVAPGKVELKLLEQELITSDSAQIFRVPSDPDFDPRADEPKKTERRASRPENLIVSKTVVFNVKSDESIDSDSKDKTVKPLTPYYTRELSITEDAEDTEAIDIVPNYLNRTHSEDDLTQKTSYPNKRRHSEYSHASHIESKTRDLLQSTIAHIKTKVLTPFEPPELSEQVDPFDTSFATNIAPSRTELKLLAKEFSCEDTNFDEKSRDLLDPSDDIFQAKALTPEPSNTTSLSHQDLDPFDTSFASDLNPGKTELKLLESELLG